MNANLLRRVNWLWKHRHTHDGDTTQSQIEIIRTIIEERDDDISEIEAGLGAYIQLVADSQTIAGGGEALEWTAFGNLGVHSVGPPSFPGSTVTIERDGYYNVGVSLDWETFTGGGSVFIFRTRGELIELVYPTSFDPGIWSSDIGARFVETAHAIPCLVGDQLEVHVDPGASSQDTVTATLSVYLVDRVSSGVVAETGLIDAVASYDTSAAATGRQIQMTSAQAAGDMMLMFLVSGPTWASYPSGWTTLIDNYNWSPDPSSGHFSVLYRVSDGTEMNVTADLSGGTAFHTAHAVWVIRSGVDYSATPPTAASPITSDPGTVNPPAVTPAQGAGNYMVFPLVAHNGGTMPATDGPDGYEHMLTTENIADNQTNRAGLDVWRASVIVATSVDPSTASYTGFLGDTYGSTTIAVRI